MIRRVIVTGMVASFMLMFIAACGLLQEPEEASGTIEAIPLEVAAAANDEAQGLADEASSEEAADEESVAEETADEEPAAEKPAEAAGSGLVIFTISPEGSEVRFELNEVLRGQPKTVVGTTNQVAGELAVDINDLSTVQAGVIQINARTLATDNDFRNRAIANEILQTGANEFITFTPTAVNGLPDSVSEGETVNFTIVGDLTIRGVTAEATFDVEATVDSATQLSGAASTIVLRSDYGLNIPSVPNVANVEEEVELYIDFVASAN
jgi:polyisoprenoid-binding protein YceI